MNQAIETYFHGEKYGGLVLAAVGVVMLVTALVFFPARHELRAFAITAGVWGVLQLAIGVGLFFKTDAQVAALVAQAPSAMLQTERPRMEKVQRNFEVLEVVWVALVIVGALVGWRLKDHHAVAGVAAAIVINAGVLLMFDLVAERRGATYLAALTRSAS